MRDRNVPPIEGSDPTTIGGDISPRFIIQSDMKKKLFIFALIVVGFTSVVAQVLLLRELITVFYGNELSLGVIFSSWMFWIAIGSFFLGRQAGKFKQKLTLFIISQILLSLALPLEVLAIRLIRPILNIPPGEIIGFSFMFYSSFSLLAPLCIISGFQFTLGCKIYAESKKEAQAVGQVYLLDAIGDMLGGLAFGYLFVYYFSSLETVIYMAILNLLSALTLLFGVRPRYSNRGQTPADRQDIPVPQPDRNAGSDSAILKLVIVSLLIFNLYLLTGSRLSNLSKAITNFQWKGFHLVDEATSLYGNLVITKKGDLYSLFENGLLMFTTPVRIVSEELVHFPALEVPHPQQVLIIGDAVGGALQELLKHKVQRVYYLELDPAVIELSKKYVPLSDRKALGDKRVKVCHLDGRLFVKRYKKDKFDLVIINLPDPLTAQLNRFYSLEFFKEVKRIISKEGVLSFSITSNENYLSEEMKNFNASIYKTLKVVFPHVLLIPGESLIFIASLSPKFLTYDCKVLSGRLKRRGIKTRFVNEYYLPSRFYRERIDFVSSQLMMSKQAKLNYDFHPISYYYGLVLFSTYFSSSSQKVFYLLSKINLKGIIITLSLITLLLFAFKKKTYKSFVPLSILTTGFAGIALEIVLIFSFQVLYGYVYHQIGIIVASFMVGLVVGTSLMNKRLERLKKEVLSLAGLEFSLIIYALLIPLVFKSLSLQIDKTLIFLAVQVLFPLLTIIIGVITGLEFPLATKICLKELGGVEYTAGILYALDLIGACIGSLLSSVLFMPLLGLTNTCLVLALLNTATLILLLSRRGKQLP